MNKILHTWMWWFLNLIVPLLSMGAVWLLRNWKGNRVSFREIMRDGQICFYAIAVLAASLSEILPSANPALPKGSDNGFVTPEIFCLVFAVFAYGAMSADYHSKTPELSQAWSSYVSCGIAGFAILLALGAHYF